MRTITILLGLTVGGMLACGACSDDETGSTGTSTTSSSSSSSTTTSTSSSTTSSSSGGAGGCDIDFVQTWGSTQECNDCVSELCCTEAEDFEANPTEGTYQALWSCTGEDPACLLTCKTPACNGSVSFRYNAPCAAYVDENCCAAVGACLDDAQCASCAGAFAFTADPCCENEAYLALDACWRTDECELSLIEREPCAAGGAGGAGAAGGSGGSGGGG